MSWDKTKKIEYLLFDITQLITISFLFFWFAYSFVANYTQIIKLIYLVCFLFYSGVFISNKLGLSFRLSTSLYYGFALVTLAFAWLPAGGISGMVMHMFFLVFISGLLVLPIGSFFLFITSSLLVVVVNIYLEFTFPGIAAPYASEMDRIKDLSISGIIGLAVIGFCLFTFKRAYVKDRDILKSTIDELEDEKEKVLSADKAKSDFLAIISHEMRTPLNGVVGVTELLEETDLNTEQKQLIASLTYSSELLHGLISDILDITLIENGELVLHENTFELKEEISSSLDLVKPNVEKKGQHIELIFENDPRIPDRLVGDSLRLRQVLLNLINNAIKFTEEGFIKVETELTKETDEFVFVKFTISDTGIGISEKDQSLLFSKFFKADVESTIEGTGLGLSISQSLVSLMGGEIEFISEEERGSSFFFEVPFKHGYLNPFESESVELKQRPIDDIKVLIAEDVLVNQLVLKMTLERLGIKEISLANNGEQAFQMVKKDWFDIVFMDIQMPVMDGFEASRAISNLYEGRQKPIIIAVTANVLGTDIEEYTSAGINEYISKPITKNSLWDVLSKFI